MPLFLSNSETVICHNCHEFMSSPNVHMSQTQDIRELYHYRLEAV